MRERSKSAPQLDGHFSENIAITPTLQLPRYENDDTQSFDGESYAIIKASPNESKFMQVMLAAQDGVLRISIVQNQGGLLQTFRLARLVIKELIVCWHWNVPDVFIVCMNVAGKLEGNIWCYTTPSLRRKWLTTLEMDGARVAHLGKYCEGMNFFDNLHMDNLHMRLPGTRQEHKKAALPVPKKKEKKDYFWLHACVVLFCSAIAEFWMSYSPL